MAQSRSQLTPNISANQAAYSVSIVGKKVTVNTEGTSVASQPRVTVQRPPIQIGGSRRPVNTGTLPCNVTIGGKGPAYNSEAQGEIWLFIHPHANTHME